MPRFFSIVLVCIAAAILYGLVHDQITVRISLEYFSVLHPPILPPNTSPTVLALAWGVIATWWVGLILGIILGIACCAGPRPQLSARDVIGPIACLLVVMAFGAALAGFIGHTLISRHTITPDPDLTEILPPDKIVGVVTDWFTHLASYAIGFVGGITIAIRAYIRRGRLIPT